MRPFTHNLIASLLVFTCIAPASAQELDLDLGAPAAERFHELAAARLALHPDQIEMQPIEGPVRLDDTGIVLWVAAGRDVRGSAKAVIALDAEGREVDLDRALAAENELALRRRGKRTLLLDRALAARDAGQRLPVMVWLDTPDVSELRLAHAELVGDLDQSGMLTRERAEVHQLELGEQVSAVLRPVTEGFAARMRSAGRRVIETSESAPVVFLELDADEIESLQSDAEVLSVDYAGGQYDERLDVAVSEIKADFVHDYHVGATGQNVRVGIVEPGRVCTSNGYLSVAGTRSYSNPTSGHTTGVASCVKSTHPTHTGVAPGARIYSAGGATTNPSSTAAIDWALSRGCKILNLSYGAVSPGYYVTAFDRYLDYVVRNRAVTFTIACGNSGNYAGDPGAGYNAIAVGNYFDRGSAAWSGEYVWGTSSWRNPNTGVETPQVAAPGTSIRMLSCGGGTNYQATGTSFSAPIVAGVCALAAEEAPVLLSWPEAMRAVVMATAWHNIEGARDLSSKDGAGGVDAKAAWAVAYRGSDSFRYGVLTRSSFDTSGNKEVQRSWANAGQRVRCVLSWDSTVSGGPNYNSDVLASDLDLWIYRPDGALTAASAKALQPFEVVEFIAPQTGFYTMKVHRRRFTSGSEYYGTAMTTSFDQ